MPLEDVAFDIVDEVVNIGISNRELIARLPCAANNFFAIVGHARAISLDDVEADLLIDAFFGCKSSTAGRTLPSTTDHTTALGHSGIDDSVLVTFTACRTPHNEAASRYRSNGAAHPCRAGFSHSQTVNARTSRSDVHPNHNWASPL